MRKMFCGGLTCLIVCGFLAIAVAQQSGSTMSAAATAKNASGLSAADRKFVKEAAEGGMAEVELGQLAVEKASSDDVKKFGQRMVDDHSKANEKLKMIAASKSLTLPEGPNAAQKATKERLSKLSGAQFDKAYMRDMVQDHKKDVAAFKTESTSGRDADIKNFASETLPTIQDHLKMAESVAPKTTQANANTSSKPSPIVASR